MLPKGYVGLVVADTRRAMAWQAGLQRAGLEVLRIETRGDDTDKGDWQIAVASRDAREAQAFVSAVLRGERSLPSSSTLSRTGQRALLGVALTLLIVLIASWLATR